MPEDWKIIQLSDIADFISGYSYKGTELQNSTVAMATIKNFDRSGGFKLDGFKEIIPSSKLKSTQYVELFDTLVAHTDLTQNAEVIGNAEILYSKNSYQNIIISMDVVKVLPKQGISKFLLAAILKDNRFKQHCMGYINGTTVLHLSKKALPEYCFAFPKDVNTTNALSILLQELYKKIALNIEENTRLSALRDALLPKLMSGEIDVSNVDISTLTSTDKLSFRCRSPPKNISYRFSCYFPLNSVICDIFIRSFVEFFPYFCTFIALFTGYNFISKHSLCCVNQIERIQT